MYNKAFNGVEQVSYHLQTVFLTYIYFFYVLQTAFIIRLHLIWDGAAISKMNPRLSLFINCLPYSYLLLFKPFYQPWSTFTEFQLNSFSCNKSLWEHTYTSTY